jgi:hypothetical protein
MAITNGYCTLAEAKQRLMEKRVYTATTISFDTTADTIADTGYGLGFLEVGDAFTVTGSTSNDGTYTVATVTSAAAITVDQNLTTEVAGDTVIMTQIYSKASAVSPGSDSILEAIIEAASRRIDLETGRTWYGNTETRKFIVGKDTDDAVLYLDKPLLSVTTLTNGDSEVLTADTEYVLEPINASAYSQVRLTPSSGKTWQFTADQYEDFVTIAGSWGNAASTPANVKEACLLMTARLWKRKDAVFGVAGTTSLGTQVMRIPMDPDIKALLPSKLPWSYDY